MNTSWEVYLMGGAGVSRERWENALQRKSFRPRQLDQLLVMRRNSVPLEISADS